MKSYGNLALTNASPPQSFSEPLTLAEVREFLNLPEVSVTAEDTLSFPAIVDGGSQALTFAMAGVAPGDQITPAWPSTLEDGLFGQMIVTATDTVEVRLFNLSGADITPAAQVFSARSGTGSTETSALLEGFIIGAREVAETLYGKELIQKQYDLTLDYFPCEEIDLPMPLVSVDLVRRRDSGGSYTTLVEGSDYVVDLARGLILPPYATYWPQYTEYPSGSVLVRFTSGYSADHPFWSNAGQRLLVGMKLLISAWYNNRLPFEVGNAMNEYGFTVSALFGLGSIPRVG